MVKCIDLIKGISTNSASKPKTSMFNPCNHFNKTLRPSTKIAKPG